MWVCVCLCVSVCAGLPYSVVYQLSLLNETKLTVYNSLFHLTISNWGQCFYLNEEEIRVLRFRSKLICGRLGSGFLLALEPLNWKNHFWHLVVFFQCDHKMCVLFQQSHVHIVRNLQSQPGWYTGEGQEHKWKAYQHILIGVIILFIVEIKVLTHISSGKMTLHAFIWTCVHISRRWRAASLGSDPLCVPGQWSPWPQKTLDPPACSTGRRKGVCEKNWITWSEKMILHCFLWV